MNMARSDRLHRTPRQATRWCAIGVFVVAGMLLASAAARAATSDHVASVVVYQGRFYDDPDATSPEHMFVLEVVTDTTVTLVEFHTPAGNDYQIPKQELTETGDIETWWYEDNGQYRWGYEGEFAGAASLGDYGDGNYVITVHYQGGGQGQTTVWFGAQGTQNPLTQPTQKPDWVFPTNLASAMSPVTFQWGPATDPSVNLIVLYVEDVLADDDVADELYPANATQSAPIALNPGLYLADVNFANGHEGNNADGIAFTVAKGISTEVSFAVNTGTPGSIAIGGEWWGFIAQPQEIDEYTFDATAGQELVIDVDALAFGSELDSVVILYGPGAGGPEIDRDDDSGDLAGDFEIEMELVARRQGNAGTPWHEAVVWVNTLDSRLYFTVPQDGTYRIAIGDYDNIEEGEDGAWGSDAFYRIRLLLASQLPEVDPHDVQVTLEKPGGGTETLGCETWDDGAEYYLDVYDTRAALEARFPDGTYTVRADYGGGDVRERSFDFGGSWPDFPYVEQPTDGQSGVPEPVVVAWQPVAQANWMWIGVYEQGSDEDEWEEGFPPDQTSAAIPQDITEAGQWYTASVEAEDSTHPDRNIFVAKWSGTLIDFQPAGNISDHVFSIEMENCWDYDDPADPSDTIYEFYLEVETDDTVDRIEFQTPAGNTFEITNAPYTQNGDIRTWHYLEDGSWWWEYDGRFAAPSGLAAYGDGTYTITVYYVGGGQQSTTLWFGIPGTGNPIPQPTQEPVITFPPHLGTVTSPVTFTWDACTDPNATSIWLDVYNDATGAEIDSEYATSATSSAPLGLAPGSWQADLSFDRWYAGQVNADGIPYEMGKYSESDYDFTVQATGGISDHVFSIELDNHWDYEYPSDPNDTHYDFGLEVETDDTVERIEFHTPAGNTFEITNAPETQNGDILDFGTFSAATRRQRGRLKWLGVFRGSVASARTAA